MYEWWTRKAFNPNPDSHSVYRNICWTSSNQRHNLLSSLFHKEPVHLRTEYILQGTHQTLVPHPASTYLHQTCRAQQKRLPRNHKTRNPTQARRIKIQKSNLQCWKRMMNSRISQQKVCLSSDWPRRLSYISVQMVGKDLDWCEFTDWGPDDSEAANGNAHLWEESWDDDDTSEDFSKQLKYVPDDSVRMSCCWFVNREELDKVKAGRDKWNIWGRQALQLSQELLTSLNDQLIWAW